MRPRVTRRVLALRGLPREMDGIRVAHLSDIHHGCWMPLEQVERVVAQANALRPDLVLLTGDYVHQSPAYIDPVARALGALRARMGAVAVLGNHDWWEGAPRMRQALAAAGIPLVDNGRLVLTPEGRLEPRAERGLCIAGIGDLWEDETDFAAALDGVPDAMPRLLMSHNPDAAEEDALSRGGWRVDLMLSGHTHGGQVWVPGLGHPVVPSRYGQKYAGGLVQGPACPVLVSAGIGMAVLPVRFATPPEIIELTLRAPPSTPSAVS
jgi:hypothetical protein